MHVLLVSGRAVDARVHPSRAHAGQLAVDLAAAGHRVRWLCLLRPDESAPAAIEGVSILEQRAEVPSFRAVQARLFDLPSERRIMALLREDPADVAHFLAGGSAISTHLAWLADRLGVPTVVSIEAAELLCHRGTLVDETGARCDRFDQAERCVECCLSSTSGGLRPWQARVGRMLRGLADLSPFPNVTAFRNRLDIAVGSLLFAGAVVVPSEGARDALLRVGVPKRALRVVGDPSAGYPSAEELLSLYESVRAAHS